MNWLLDRAPAQDYHDLWCPDGMRVNDPEGCATGLAIGYIWLPLAALMVITMATCLMVSAYRVFTQRETSDTGTPSPPSA